MGCAMDELAKYVETVRFLMSSTRRLTEAFQESVTARKDAAPAACQAAISNVAAVMPFPGGGGLIQTTPGCRQQRVLRLHRRG